MTKVYILKNQNHQYLNRQNEWVNASEATSLMRTAHKDEAINAKVEQTVKNPDLRLEIVHCPTNTKGIPILEENTNSLNLEPTIDLAAQETNQANEEKPCELNTEGNKTETVVAQTAEAASSNHEEESLASQLNPSTISNTPTLTVADGLTIASSTQEDSGDSIENSDTQTGDLAAEKTINDDQ